MQKLFATFAAIVSFLSCKASAEERTFSGKIIVGDSSEYTYSDSSEAYRQHTQYSIGLSRTEELLSLNWGYYWNPDFLIEIDQRLFSGRDLYLANSSYWERDETAVGIKNSIFFKNLWVFSYGLYYRKASYSQKYQYVDDKSDSHVLKIKRRDLAGQLSIGNRWQWSWFYLGVDWLAYEWTLKVLSASADSEDLNPSRESLDSDAMLDFAKSRSKSINKEHNIYTNIKVGFSF